MSLKLGSRICLNIYGNDADHFLHYDFGKFLMEDYNGGFFMNNIRLTNKFMTGFFSDKNILRVNDHKKLNAVCFGSFLQ